MLEKLVAQPLALCEQEIRLNLTSCVCGTVWSMLSWPED